MSKALWTKTRSILFLWEFPNGSLHSEKDKIFLSGEVRGVGEGGMEMEIEGEREK